MQSIERVLETPLAATHRAAGTKMGVWFGCVLPDKFSDPREEQRYLNESVALLDKNYRAYISFTGPDRVRYLNAIVTNNLKDLREGQGTLALLLNPQGHILAELEARPEAERLFCISYAMIRQEAITWLDKYIIMDDVTLTDETERYATLGLEGPRCAELVRAVSKVSLSELSELAAVSATAGDVPCQIERRSSMARVAGVEFLVERNRVRELWTVLRGEAAKLGGGPVGYEALSAQRLAQGVPWFGYDFGEKQIPQEAGLEHTHISYTKGCYTGQEIIERVRSRGQVNRKRVSLRFEGELVPETGASLRNTGGTEVGHVTRAARSWYPVAVLGMGYARKEASSPGEKLTWSGGAAEVVTAPIERGAD
jgi:folate-binding protein YgfZ